MYKAEQFFSYDKTIHGQKLRIAALHFDSLAIEWHLSYLKSRGQLPFSSWKEYLYALMDRFGGEYDDVMAEFKLVRQIGTVKEYHEEFDKIMARLVIAPKHTIVGSSMDSNLRLGLLLNPTDHALYIMFIS